MNRMRGRNAAVIGVGRRFECVLFGLGLLPTPAVAMGEWDMEILRDKWQ
jgi:hypothetical protein